MIGKLFTVGEDEMTPWSVTTTTISADRKWGVRVEWLGLGYVFSLQLNPAPACRVIVCGWSLYFGRILSPPKTHHFDLGEIAASKGWKHEK